MTWGQRGIWHAIERNLPGHYNVCVSVPVPPDVPADVGTVAGAVGRLLDRHEALRTRILVADGEPRQVVERAGTLPLEVAEFAAADPHRLVEPCRAAPFDYPAGDLPVRVVLNTANGTVREILLVLCHVAVDMQAVFIVCADLTALLAGEPLSAPGPQPLDLARRQQEAAARRRSATSVEYWITESRRIRSPMFVDAGPPQRPPFRSAVLTSPAVGAGARILATRHGVTDSTVYQAACAALLGRWTGQRRCHLRMITDNRFWPGHREIVTHLCQLGLFVLDLPADTGFVDLLAETERAALRAHWHAYYDQGELDRAIDELQRGTGGTGHADCYFNDSRFDGPPVWTVTSKPATDDAPKPLPYGDGTAPVRDADVWRATALSTFGWQRDPGWMQCSFSLRVSGPSAVPSISLSADTRYLPAQEMERFLRAFEDLLVEACRDTTAVDVPR
ncbi:condensation domain-containing protein [Micromonospora sp. WMMD1102]|uniref:condensation domain-containing protein n=1 Tax=Micromonospora sp. WMMD1102 TaxID=3016105 RepID=UPI0024153D9F|nr:condensation domain-containing protein [Micromonospora sp. WMMD1102]MDG4788021.1 condensation domain-containing protein [Micromonospora sp. WMMD1102]